MFYVVLYEKPSSWTYFIYWRLKITLPEENSQNYLNNNASHQMQVKNFQSPFEETYHDLKII